MGFLETPEVECNLLPGGEPLGSTTTTTTTKQEPFQRVKGTGKKTEQGVIWPMGLRQFHTSRGLLT